MMIELPNGAKLRYRGKQRWLLIRDRDAYGPARRIMATNDPVSLARKINRLARVPAMVDVTWHVYDAHKGKFMGSGDLRPVNP